MKLFPLSTMLQVSVPVLVLLKCFKCSNITCLFSFVERGRSKDFDVQSHCLWSHRDGGN